MAKNGQFREIFNHALKKMVESGEMHKIRAKWATPGNKLNSTIKSKIPLSDQVCEEGKGRTLGFENTLPAFFIFMVGFGLCLCVLAMEIVCSKMGRLNDRQLGEKDGHLFHVTVVDKYFQMAGRIRAISYNGLEQLIKLLYNMMISV